MIRITHKDAINQFFCHLTFPDNFIQICSKLCVKWFTDKQTNICTNAGRKNLSGRGNETEVMRSLG